MALGKSQASDLTIGGAIVVYAYLTVALAMPFIADEMHSVGVFLAVWLGGSCLAGVLVPRLWMLVIPAMAFVCLLVVLLLDLSRSEFFSDPFSIIALWTLAMGEIGGLLVGVAITRRSGKMQT